METVGSGLGEVIPLLLRPQMPGANPVVSGTINNTLGFYYFYHLREAHHRFNRGLALKFPSPKA